MCCLLYVSLHVVHVIIKSGKVEGLIYFFKYSWGSWVDTSTLTQTIDSKNPMMVSPPFLPLSRHSCFFKFLILFVWKSSGLKGSSSVWRLQFLPMPHLRAGSLLPELTFKCESVFRIQGIDSLPLWAARFIEHARVLLLQVFCRQELCIVAGKELRAASSVCEDQGHSGS